MKTWLPSFELLLIIAHQTATLDHAQFAINQCELAQMHFDQYGSAYQSETTRPFRFLALDLHSISAGLGG